jgi:hypothetical protein
VQEELKDRYETRIGEEGFAFPAGSDSASASPAPCIVNRRF